MFLSSVGTLSGITVKYDADLWFEKQEVPVIRMFKIQVFAVSSLHREASDNTKMFTDQLGHIKFVPTQVTSLLTLCPCSSLGLCCKRLSSTIT